MTNFAIFFATMASCFSELGSEHRSDKTYPSEVMEEVSNWCITMHNSAISNELLGGKERMICEMAYQFYLDGIDRTYIEDVSDDMADVMHGIALSYMPVITDEDLQFFDELKSDESIPEPVRNAFTMDALDRLLNAK